MRRLAFFVLSLVVGGSAWEEYDEDDASYWNPSQLSRPTQSWPPTTTRPTPPTTRRTTTAFRPHEYRPGPDECDQYRANQMADRFFEQLMRQSNGNPLTAIGQLEARFNVRAQPGCGPYERLGTVVNAATARISAAGYGYYRPVIHALADRLADALVSGGTINVNIRPAQGSGSISATVTLSGSSNSNNNNNNRPANNRNNTPNWWSESPSTGGTQRPTTTTTRPPGWWRPASSRDLQQSTSRAQNLDQETEEIVEDTVAQDEGTPGMWEMWLQDHYSLFDYHPQSIVL